MRNIFRRITHKRQPKRSHAPTAKVVHVKSKNAPRIDDDLHKQLAREAAELNRTLPDRARKAGAV